jgi:hypothetical protein
LIKFLGIVLGKHHLGKQSRWKDNIKMDLKEISYAVVVCMELTEDSIK